LKERAAMGELVTGNRSGKPFMKQFSKRTLYTLLPHMIRLSEWSERWLEAHFAERTSTGSQCPGDEYEEDTIKRVSLWHRSRLPKPFSALPVAKLQAAMVLYCRTEVETLLGSLRVAARKRRRSEKADESPVPVLLEEMDFASVIFNVESFKGRRGAETLPDGTVVPKWRIASFRTDGVALTVTFVSGIAPPAFNADMLMKRGYDHLKAPEEAINPVSTNRGLYYVGEKRCDLAASTAPLRVKVIDPGFLKPVHVAAVDTDTEEPFHEASHWYLTEDEWIEQSGRRRSNESERRRREGTPYGMALEELNGEGRKKSATSNFREYANCMMRTLWVRATELVSTGRSAVRWQQKRQLAKFIGRLCDRMFDRTSARVSRNHSPLDVTAREELRSRLRSQLRERRTIVFFGDATYGPTMRGHGAIPKKGILRELCHRGLTVLLDEYNTSKMCPCGHDELKTTSGRLRVHKNDGAACSLLSRLEEDACDRDALASLNMVNCAMCALGGKKRPDHLCRTICPRCE
jgi:hypothetical protein